MEIKNNSTIAFDEDWLEASYIDSPSIKSTADTIRREAKNICNHEKIPYLLKAIQCIDLTTLSGDDTEVNVGRLCCRAVNPLKKQLMEKLISLNHMKLGNQLNTAAVCVYPARVSDCLKTLDKLNGCRVKIASVATGFPSGLCPLKTRLGEIEYAISAGANEIDVVIDRSLALSGNWRGLYDEVAQMRKVCDTNQPARLKVILGVGELGSLNNVYKASLAAMMAGADFIKTSTGKETINATLPVGIVMTRAIWEFQYATGVKVGFKPAGGLKTANDAIDWLKLIEMQLDETWINSSYFRIGASSLLNDVENELFKLVHKRDPHHFEVCL